MRSPSTPTAKAVRILLVSNFELVRAATAALLNTNPEFTVSGAVGFSEEAEGHTSNIQNSDVALLLASLGDKVDIIEDLLKVNPDLRVIVVGEKRDLDTQVTAVDLGAVGIVHKEQPTKVLFEAIRQTHKGETWLNQTLLTKVLEGKKGRKAKQNGDIAPKADTLTPRELHVVRMIGEGLKNKEIAEKLEITEATVRHHLSSIYGKLGVDDRLNLVIHAYENRLIEIPSHYETVSVNGSSKTSV